MWLCLVGGWSSHAIVQDKGLKIHSRFWRPQNHTSHRQPQTPDWVFVPLWREFGFIGRVSGLTFDREQLELTTGSMPFLIAYLADGLQDSIALWMQVIIT